jgi:hypothetical protein
MTVMVFFGCDAMKFDTWVPTCQRNLLLPSSEIFSEDERAHSSQILIPAYETTQ